MEEGKKKHEKKISFASRINKRHFRDNTKSNARVVRIIEPEKVDKRPNFRERKNSPSEWSRDGIEEDNLASNQVKRSYRTHPYHKPTWEKYPTISLSRKSSENGNIQAKSRTETLKDLSKQIRKNLYSDKRLGEGNNRSSGNADMSNVPVTNYHDDSLNYRVKRISLPWIMKQIARLNSFWEVFVCFTIVATLILTLFTALFSFYDKVLWEWISMADSIFFLDTFLRLCVEIWRYQNRATVVVFMTPYTQLQYIFDIISMLPLHHIYHWTMGLSKLRNLSMIGYLRFNRMFRLSRYIKFYETLERERMANDQLLFLFKFFNYLLAFIYCIACLLVLSIGMQPIDYLLYNKLENLKVSFLKRFQPSKSGSYGSTPWDFCVIAINFATTIITTVGNGNIVPSNELEMIICIGCMLSGAIFLSGYYISKMSTFRVELDIARFNHFHRLNQIRNHLVALKTLPFFNKKVKEFYNSLWSYRQGAVNVPLMRTLPLCFHEDLLADICLRMFDKSQLFYNMDLAFLRAVSKTVTVGLYNANMILCHKGSPPGKMYFILQGECQAMSKLNSANASVIIRAGSIIGEANLFFSFPYTTTVETRTCCQFIMLNRQDLLNVLVRFPIEMEILRSRCMSKIKKLYETHQAYGYDPICWVKTKTDMESPRNVNADKIKINMRWGNGFNKEVLEDIVDDSEKVVIFNTHCKTPSTEKNYLIPYISCTVPEILNTKIQWIRVWNYLIMGISFYVAFFGPYCLVFSESTKLENYLCKLQFFCGYLTRIVFVVDIFVEIYGACPVAGLRYKLYDGLGVVKYKPGFYLDILAALPFDLWTSNAQDVFHVVGITFKTLKLWKVIRFFNYLVNVYPLQQFWLRLGQFILSLLYGIHFAACILYFLACPLDGNNGTVECKKGSWLASYEIMFKLNHDPSEKIPVQIKADTLGYGGPYMYSFFYGATTFTSAGSDFSPQNRFEMIWVIVFQLLAFFLIGYFTAILTSTLSCLVRPRLALQQQLDTMYQFMNSHKLRENLKERVIEHFRLQYQLRGNVFLDSKTHIMYDAPAYLKNDVLYLEVYELLDGIPIFSKLDSDLIIKISSSMKLFLIPPNTTFVHIGEVRRIMYVIKNGSMGVFEPGDDKPVAILEASSHFGIRDLLFGEPCHYIIRSLSYISMYEIKRSELEEIFQNENDFVELVKNEKMRVKDVIHDMNMLYTYTSPKGKGQNIAYPDKAVSIPSWIKVPSRIRLTAATRLLNQEKEIAKINLLNDELNVVYGTVKWLGFCKYFLLRKTIHPVGFFSKFWNCIISLNCSFIVLALILETFCSVKTPRFRAFHLMLDYVSYVDIYLKLHWSYYNSHTQILVTHPLKTAVHYVLHGSFLMDVAICAPFELLIWIHGLTNFLGDGKASYWYSILRWNRFFQVKRIPAIFSIVGNIAKHRRTLLFTLYVLTTLFLCTIMAIMLQFIVCPWDFNDRKKGDQYAIPTICLKENWFSYTYVIGNGDMIALSRSDVYVLVCICIFGVVFMRCITADLAAAKVENDKVRTEFVEQIAVLDRIMRRENIPKKLYSSVISHLHNTWNHSRGLQPRELFQGLHPVLESELYGNLLVDRLSKVPAFQLFPFTVLRIIASYMKILYINRGQRIMRFGNLESEMYIIKSGRVYITDQHLNYICSLGPGESFGETTMMYGTARRHNAIAACNTKLYVLTSRNFKSFLERYPDFEDKMKLNLPSEKQDYFESEMERKMEAAKTLTSKQKHKMLQTFAERTDLIKDIIAQKEDFEYSGLDPVERSFEKHGKIIGIGGLDEDLPFLYFAVKPKSWKILFYPVVHPNCRFVKLFQTVVTWVCFITPAIAAYEVSFSSEFLIHPRKHVSTSINASRILHQISNAIEITFLVNIALNFCLAYEIKDGVYNKRYQSIVLRYLTSSDGFFLHLITSVPYMIEIVFDLLQIDISDYSKDFQSLYLNLFLLLRSFRLFHYFKSLLSRKNDLTLCPFRLQMTLSISSFCLTAHLLACLFYWISPCPSLALTDGVVLCQSPLEGHLNKSGWTTQYVINKKLETNPDELIAWKWWLRSLYWVITTVSTTGFGDIKPITFAEIIVSVVCMFCGAFILSLILAQFTSGMMSLTWTKRKYMHQVNLLVNYLRNIGLSEIHQTQVIMYFRLFWESSRGIPYHKSWKKLPHSMQIEIANALFGKTLLKVPIFKDSEGKIFIRQLCSRVVHSMYIPGTYIHRQGDPGTSMFVVYKGVVSGTLLTKTNNQPDLVALYNPGDAFGRFAAFFHQADYKKSYRAETMTEILEVKQQDIRYLAKMFPQFKKLISNFIETKYQSSATNKNIFDRPRRKGRRFWLQVQDVFMQEATSRKSSNMGSEEPRQRKKKMNGKQNMVDEYVKQQQQTDRVEMERGQVNKDEIQIPINEETERGQEEMRNSQNMKKRVKRKSAYRERYGNEENREREICENINREELQEKNDSNDKKQLEKREIDAPNNKVESTQKGKRKMRKSAGQKSRNKSGKYQTEREDTLVQSHDMENIDGWV